MFHLDTFCFDRQSYLIVEDESPLEMNLTLSRVLPFEITVKFLYTDETAVGKLIMYVLCYSTAQLKLDTRF